MISDREAMNLGLERLTEWEMCSRVIETQWGTRTYREWCALEALRMEKFAPAEAVLKASGHCSVWATKEE